MSHLILSVLLVLSAVACTDVPPSRGTGGTSGSGGSGGEAGMGGSAGTGGGSGNGGTAGNAFICDDGMGSGENPGCTTCVSCAAVDPCRRETERCDASLACTSFLECLLVCDEMGGGESCTNDCVSEDPEGASIYLIAQNCTFCECPTQCWDNCLDDVLECDDGTIGTSEEPDVCNDCVTCSAEGPCEASTLACDGSSECGDFLDCDIACSNDGGDVESCFVACSETHPAGAVLYYENTTCLCAQCPDNCLGATACDFY